MDGVLSVNLKQEDLEVRTYPLNNPGGQHVGLTSSGVMIIHLPSGIGVVSTGERSQYKNKEKALVMLETLVDLNGEE
jgi:peptide chain release factor 2